MDEIYLSEFDLTGLVKANSILVLWLTGLKGCIQPTFTIIYIAAGEEACKGATFQRVYRVFRNGKG